ncbi:hypothetical protein L596_024445 [Steinernema carpocapsae]|uniref:Uncharacterized protein n=1 Tax=Steinernema carpocapsae TaxID=34508 RepID=A0A4U5MGS9_STECR|nr:hypothetical protein L596_024445 [Steinernema carpocapsae]
MPKTVEEEFNLEHFLIHVSTADSKRGLRGWIGVFLGLNESRFGACWAQELRIGNGLETEKSTVFGIGCNSKTLRNDV